ncbi:MAG: hypothetical protein WCJ35_14725 [Planctomycetota bacterium]
MDGQKYYHYLNEFQTRPKARRWWPKAIATLAVIGSIYGAAIGSATSTTNGAVDVIAVAAIIMALACGVPGSRYGFFFGIVNRIRFGRLFVGTFAAMGGAILGGFLGIVVAMPLGAIIGAFGGWFFTRATFRRGLFLRLLGGFVSILLGSCIGATVLALQRDQAAALMGIAWGIGIGGIAAPLLLLLLIGTLNFLPRWRPRS